MTSRMIAVAALLTVLSGPAFGGDESAPPAPLAATSCNYLDNALIGTRCAGTFAVGAGLSSTMRKVEDPESSLVGKADWKSPFEFIRVTPTSWLTLGFSSEFTDYDSRFQAPGILLGRPNDRRSWASFLDRQTFFANVGLIDTGPGASRYVVNLFAGDAYVPEHDSHSTINYNSSVYKSSVYKTKYSAVNNAFVGYTSGAKWQLGQAGVSLNAFSSFEANFNTDVEFVRLFWSTRLLLSNDTLGIGVGPVFSSAYIVSDIASGFPKDAYAAGLEVIAQPFKDSGSVFLAGLVLDASVKQSIGQAGFVNELFDARETVVEGSARFNFKY